MFSGNFILARKGEGISLKPFRSYERRSKANWEWLLDYTRVCNDIHVETRLLPWVHGQVWCLANFKGVDGDWIKMVGPEIVNAIRNLEMYAGHYVDPDDMVQEPLDLMAIIGDIFPALKRLGFEREPEMALTQQHKDAVREFARNQGWQVVFRSIYYRSHGERHTQ